MPFSLDSVDHINVKIFARTTGPVNLDAAIPMFHRWIQESLLDALVIDVADYRHVPAGPGVMLIGHAANYSLDLAFSRLGLLYNSKLPTEGTLDEKLQTAFGSALAACALVEEDPAFRGKIEFDAGDVEIAFNDRLLVPNDEATWNTLRPAIEAFLNHLFGRDAYTLEHVGEPRERLRLGAKALRYVPVSTLLERSGAVAFKQ